MKTRKASALVAFLVVVCLQVAHLAQVPGDRVRLQSTSTLGVPVHPAAGDNSYVRWANGTVGTVVSIDQATGRLEIESEGKRGWVTRRGEHRHPGAHGSNGSNSAG